MRCYNCGNETAGFSHVKFVGGKGVRIFCKKCKDVKRVEKDIPKYILCKTEVEENVVRLARVLNGV